MLPEQQYFLIANLQKPETSLQRENSQGHRHNVQEFKTQDEYLQWKMQGKN